MASCTDCGFPIVWVETEEGGEKIPIDERPSLITDLGGFYYPDPQNHPKLVKPMITKRGYGYGDHRRTCPSVTRNARL